MLVTIIGKNSMNRLVLPKNIIGNYWLGDKKNDRIVNIESINGKWQITSTNEYKIIELIKNSDDKFVITKKVIDKVILKNYIFFFKNPKHICCFYRK